MDKAEIVSTLRDMAVNDPTNRQEDGELYFDAPLVGFADGADPLFSEYKRIIGDHHLTPSEAFMLGTGTNPGKVTVISWSLPIVKATRKEQREEEKRPSRRWVRTRHFGQLFNDSFARSVADFLKSRGIATVIPNQLPAFKNWEDERLGWTSNWSERHTAFAAGLGTFSLNDGLITAHGIAHRLGSVVAAIALTPDKRAGDIYGNCLYMTKGKCAKCVKRCPCGALSKKGHDKGKCFEYVYNKLPPLVGEKFGVASGIVGCGLCQANVPCEKKIP